MTRGWIGRARFAGAAAVAIAVFSIGAVHADTGDPLILGQMNIETSATTISYTQSTVSYDTALYVTSNAGGAAITASSSSNFGVSADGVAAGIFGQSSEAYGVEGLAQQGPPGPVTNGRAGVRGQGPIGVLGDASSPYVDGVGVRGVGSNVGVEGQGSFIGVRATGQIGLQVNGLATFSRSGTVTITFPNTSATVSGVPVSGSTLILATAQENAGVSVQAAVPNVATGSGFTIYLDAAPGSRKKPGSVTIAWFALN